MQDIIHNFRFKCKEKISQADGQGYFKSYWASKSCERQTDFIYANVKEDDPN